MTRKELLARISTDPNVCSGQPCIRRHRIWVSLVLDLLSSGWTVAHVLEQYPRVEEADVRACIAYGAEMSLEPSGRNDSLCAATAFKALIDAHPEEQAWLAEWNSVDLASPLPRQP